MTRFAQSFLHAFDGIVDATRAQPNLGVHLVVTAIVLLLSLALHLTLLAFVAILLLIALVLGLELMNTAVEAQVDLASPHRHPLAKKAKDTAAGAVLVVSIGAVLAGAAIFAQAMVAGYSRPALPSLDVQTVVAGLAVTAVLTVLAKARFGRGFSGRATLLWAALALMYAAPLMPRLLGYWPEGIVAGLASYAAFSRRPFALMPLLGGMLLPVGAVCLCLLAHDPRVL